MCLLFLLSGDSWKHDLFELCYMSCSTLPVWASPWQWCFEKYSTVWIMDILIFFFGMNPANLGDAIDTTVDFLLAVWMELIVKCACHNKTYMLNRIWCMLDFKKKMSRFRMRGSDRIWGWSEPGLSRPVWWLWRTAGATTRQIQPRIHPSSH